MSFLEKAWKRFEVGHPEHQQTFLALCKSSEALPVSKLVFAVQLDRVKLNMSLSALEALMLVEYTDVGMAKNYFLTGLGQKFAREVLQLQENN